MVSGPRADHEPEETSKKDIEQQFSSTMVMRLYTSIRKGFMPRAMCTDW